MKPISKHSRLLLVLLLIAAGLAGAMAPQTAAAKDTKPPKPGGFVSGYPVATSPFDIEVKWKPAKDNVTKQEELRYRLCWKKVSETKWTYRPSGHIYRKYNEWNHGNAKIMDLEPGTEYEIDVEVYDEAGNLESYCRVQSSYYIKVKTLIDNEAPSMGGYVAGYPKATSPTTIEVRWNPATDNFSPQGIGYRVVWRKKSSETSWHSNYPFEDFPYEKLHLGYRSYKITGLDANTKYEVAVVAVDDSDNNKWDEIVEVTTPPVPDTEAPTPGIYLSGYPKATSPTTIELKWARGEDNVTPRNELGYRVEWKTEAETDWTWHTYSEELPWDLTEYTIPNLKPGTTYHVRVTIHDYAKNKASYGIKTVTTPTATGDKDTEAPEKGTYVGDPVVTASTITLKWTPGKDNKTPTDKLRYRFIWMKVTDKEWNSSVPDGAPLTILPQNITEYSFESLASGIAYWVNVGAYDEAGNYVWYGAKKVTTLTENTIAIKLTPEKMEVGANQQSKEVGVSCDKAFRITGIGTMSDWISNFSPTSEEVKTQHSVTFNVKANPGAERTGKLVINTTRGSLTLIVTQAAKSAEEGNKAPEPQGYVGNPVVTSSTIKLKWNPAKDDHTAQKDLRYMVGWRLPSEEEWKTSSSEVDMPKNITEYEIKGLKENTEYIVFVAVVDEAGKETRYGELKITTLPKGTKPDEPNPNPGVVSKPVTSLTLDQTAVTVNGNLESFLLKAVVLPADADNPGLKWSSSNPSVASVVAVSGEAPEPSGKLLRSGPVTGRTVAVHIHSKGKAVITAQTIDGSNKSATCQVDVLATVGNMEASATRIYTSAGRLYLSLPTATPVEIYTLLGVRLRTFIAPAGESSVALPQGVYVVRAGRKIEKVVAN